MISDCLGSIFRTTGHKPAGWRRQWRDQPLVKTQCESGNARHCFTLLIELRPAAIAAKACPISLVNAPKSISAADLRGLKTTSTGCRSFANCLRTAARIRRRMRLRITAPPSARPTVSPMRGPASFACSCVSILRKKNTLILEEKCRWPARYTRSKSACFSRRALLGNDSEETFTAGDVAAGASGSSGVYSRNPGFTETRFRLLARRRESTARPPCVRMRTRNPCVLERRRRLG